MLTRRINHLWTRDFIPVLALMGSWLLAAPNAHAGSVALSKVRPGQPATDLVNSDRVEDLSILDPAPSELWGAPSDPLQHYPLPQEAHVRLETFLPSIGGIWRSQVSWEDPHGTAYSYQLMLSLDSHAALARNRLLRKLGYPLPVPRPYRELTVRFSSESERDRFLDGLSATTLVERSRWVAPSAKGDDPLSVTIYDAVLEPARADAPMVHWGFLPTPTPQGKRAARALIVPLTLLDIPESINLYSWETGRILDRSVLLTHPNAESFQETTYDDGRWIARKIAKLSPQELTQAVAEADYPDEVARLILEKLFARRNQLIELFDLESDVPRDARQFPYSTDLTFGAIKKGELTRADYPTYAPRFSYGDPDAPLTWSQLWRYGGIQALSGGISTLLGEVSNRVLTAQSIDRLTLDHAKKNLGKPFVRPLGLWGGPLGGASIKASRNVLTGNYYGSDAPMQVVDELSVQASAGWFLSLDGIPAIVPSVTGNVTVGRSFLHVRPVKTVKEAWKVSWADLWVPGFMQQLQALLDTPAHAAEDEIQRSLAKFMEAFKEGEMVVVNDIVTFNGSLGLSVPIPLLLTPGLGFLNPAFGLRGNAQPMVLKRTTLTRTAQGLQIYVQASDVLAAEAALDFNWVVRLARLSKQWRGATGATDAYLIPVDPETGKPTVPERELALALRTLLISNNPAIIREHFSPYRLKHRLTAATRKAQLLHLTWLGVDETHRVRVTPPDDPDAARTLLSYRSIRRNLSDIGELFTANAAISKLNPLISLTGKSQWSSVSAEREITPGLETPPTTRIEERYSGGVLPKRQFLKLIDKLEEDLRPLNLEKPLIRRDEFANTRTLEMYELNSTLLIYSSGMRKFIDATITPPQEDAVVAAMTEIEGQDQMLDYCESPLRRFWNDLTRATCLKPWMRKILNLREELGKKGAPKKEEGRLKLQVETMRMLQRELGVTKLLKWLGPEHYFVQLRVSGFRAGDEDGDSQYFSDSLGKLDGNEGGGTFAEFAAKYGISSHELQARYLNEGY